MFQNELRADTSIPEPIEILAVSIHVLSFHLLITFAISLDPDQALQNVRPDLDLNCLTLMIFLKYFIEKLHLKKKAADDKKACKLPSIQRVNNMVRLFQYELRVNTSIPLTDKNTSCKYSYP